MERDAYFDNAKVILIFLVVFGHMIQPFIANSQSVHTFYMWVYTFHMPAFIFVSGFFAKGSGNMRYIKRLAQKLLIPYLIFQIIYTAFYVYIGKSGWQTDLFYPQWSLWFLLSLFCWHILLIFFRRLNPFIGIAIALQLGIVIGYFSEVGHTYSLSRTFVFFPFFLIGYWVTAEHINYLKHRFVQIGAIFIMGLIAWAIYVAPDFNSGWLLASKSYDVLGLPKHGGFARLLVYTTSLIMVIGFLAWVPKQRFIWTTLGEYTLYVYLLHGFFIQYFRETGLFQLTNIFEFIGLALLSAFLVVILASRPIIAFAQPFIEGRLTAIRNLFNRRNINPNE